MTILDIISKFYGKVGISWILFHLIWKIYILYTGFYIFCLEITPGNNAFLNKVAV